MSDSDSKRDPEPRARRSNRPPGRGYEVGVAPASAPVPTRRSPPPELDRLRRIARGPVLLAIDAEVERRFGDDGRERVVALLPDAHADELRRGRPSALEAHDIDAVRIYLEIASRVLGIDAATFQDFGRVAVDRELAPFVKTLVLPGSLPDVLRRCVTIVSRFLSFGIWTVVKSTPELGTIRVEDVGVLSPLLRSWYLGVIEGIVRRSVSPDAVVVDTSSVDAGPSVLEIEIELDTPPSRLSGSPVSSHPGS